jgi:hypothetical protein
MIEIVRFESKADSQLNLAQVPRVCFVQAAVTANRLLAPWGTYDNQIA